MFLLLSSELPVPCSIVTEECLALWMRVGEMEPERQVVKAKEETERRYRIGFLHGS
jgi:hypothetical protein